MSIIDDVVVNAKSAVTKVSKRAEQIIDKSKLQHAENGINNEIDSKLEELGLYVYESTINGYMNKAELKEKISELNELYKQADTTRAMIAVCKNKRACVICGGYNEKDAVFCNKCGKKLNDNTAEFDKVNPRPLEIQNDITTRNKIKEDVKVSVIEELKDINIDISKTNNETQNNNIIVEEIESIKSEDREIFSNSQK